MYELVVNSMFVPECHDKCRGSCVYKYHYIIYIWTVFVHTLSTFSVERVLTDNSTDMKVCWFFRLSILGER